MALIMVNPEDLVSLAAEFDEVANNIIKNDSRIYGLIDRLDHSWQGEASTAYMQKIKSEMQCSKNLAQILMELSKNLMQLSQVYQEAESNLTSRIVNMIEE